MEIRALARKHGYEDDDITHALVVADLEPDADPPKILVIGPDRSGHLLEVIISSSPMRNTSRSMPCHCAVRSTASYPGSTNHD